MVCILEGIRFFGPLLPSEPLASQQLVHLQGRIRVPAHPRHPAAKVLVQRRATNHAQAIALGQVFDLKNNWFGHAHTESMKFRSMRVKDKMPTAKTIPAKAAL